MPPTKLDNTKQAVLPARSAEVAERRAGEPAARSEVLLPATPEGAGDDRYRVAEEVNLDQQSDAARRIGQAPAEPGAVEAMAQALQEGASDTAAPGSPSGVPRPGG